MITIKPASELQRGDVFSTDGYAVERAYRRSRRAPCSPLISRARSGRPKETTMHNWTLAYILTVGPIAACVAGWVAAHRR